MNITNLLDTIRDNASNMYQTRVPAATDASLEQVGKAILVNDELRNEFITALIDKVAFSHIKSKAYKNPLARLKGVGVPYGKTIEEIYIEPAKDAGFDNDGTKLLKTTKPDGKACYYALNRQGCYPVTISEAQLARAFKSEEDFMSVYSAIIASLESGDEIDEFMLAKNVIGKSIDNDSILVIDSDIAKPKELAKSISKVSKSFNFPSTAFNGYNRVNAEAIAAGDTPCTTFCRPERQCLIITADAQTEIDYEVLATMFNMEVSKLEAITILVDEIPSEKYDIYAVLCDIDAIQMRDAEYKTTSQYIASNLSYNVFLHHWQYIYTSMFGNMAAFGKAKAGRTRSK